MINGIQIAILYLPRFKGSNNDEQT